MAYVAWVPRPRLRAHGTRYFRDAGGAHGIGGSCRRVGARDHCEFGHADSRTLSAEFEGVGYSARLYDMPLNRGQSLPGVPATIPQ